MLKNTKLLIVFLAVFAALVVGANIGRQTALVDNLQNITQKPTTPAPSPATDDSETQNQDLNLIAYANDHCGLSMGIPENINKLEANDGNVIFIDPKDPQNTAVLICQEQLTKPKGVLVESDIQIGSASADIYREGTESAQTLPTYHLTLSHPQTNLQILISGTGQLFEVIANTLSLN